MFLDQLYAPLQIKELLRTLAVQIITSSDRHVRVAGAQAFLLHQPGNLLLEFPVTATQGLICELEHIRHALPLSCPALGFGLGQPVLLVALPLKRAHMQHGASHSVRLDRVSVRNPCTVPQNSIRALVRLDVHSLPLQRLLDPADLVAYLEGVEVFVIVVCFGGCDTELFVRQPLELLPHQLALDDAIDVAPESRRPRCRGWCLDRFQFLDGPGFVRGQSPVHLCYHLLPTIGLRFGADGHESLLTAGLLVRQLVLGCDARIIQDNSKGPLPPVLQRLDHMIWQLTCRLEHLELDVAQPPSLQGFADRGLADLPQASELRFCPAQVRFVLLLPTNRGIDYLLLLFGLEQPAHVPRYARSGLRDRARGVGDTPCHPPSDQAAQEVIVAHAGSFDVLPVEGLNRRIAGDTQSFTGRSSQCPQAPLTFWEGLHDLWWQGLWTNDPHQFPRCGHGASKEHALDEQTVRFHLASLVVLHTSVHRCTEQHIGSGCP